jgi:gluconokinase
MIVILMGVSGSGKSTVAHELAALTGWKFAEGDDYHSEANRRKMHSGIPLTDEDRAPWLASLHAVLLGWLGSGESGILACSALRQSYRDILSKDLPPAAYRFVLLDVPAEILQVRMNQRPGHFMNPALLKSQLQTLELPKDALCVDATQPPATVARNILSQLTPA